MFFELACEAAYPVSEGSIGSLFILFYNISGGIFLLVLMIPNIGTEWMNYSLVGSLILSLLILFMIKEKYSRTDIDIDVTDDKNNDKKSFINT
ncbi:hypothetical protein KUTeg_015501 [Tegillarca granosa]|uniref:Uncharacterized protein n=1 Tax=Tegillarca granosa TaxID=220873 RepID=A0ABQ9EQ93_TEGGR|nr:hypothetical protein KUTeg_015501 [Tegillarca granosa]